MSTTPAPRDPSVTYEFVTKRLIIQDRSGRKYYEKMLAKGWEVDHIADGFGRSNHYVFRRPKVAARDKPGSLGGVALRGMDKIVDKAKDPEFQAQLDAKLQAAKDERATKSAERKSARLEKKRLRDEKRGS